MKSSLVSVLCFVLALWVFPISSHAVEDALLGWQGKPLVIGIADEYYPPFHYYTEDRKLEGFDVQIANALCAKMQAKCQIIAVPIDQGKLIWDRVIGGLRAKKFDALVSGLTITPDRLKLVDFTDPYIRFPAAFLVRKGMPLVATPEGLRGLTIAVDRACPNWSSQPLTYLRKKFGKDLKVKVYDSARACPKRGYFLEGELKDTRPQRLTDLKGGVVDAVFDEKFLLYAATYNKELGQSLDFAGGDLFDYNLQAIAIRKKQSNLKAALNAAIAAILADGTYKRIESSYNFPFTIYGD